MNFNNSEDWLLLKKYCRNNFINQIDFFRYEDMHTNFLKSLFESNNVYGLTIYPLKKFIELIKMKDETKFKEINIFDDYDISHVKIESQKQINNYRLDLFIQFEINDKPYIIVLENKLFSSENNEQCLKYEITCQEALKDKNEIIFVYLSLSNDSKISSNNYVRINYQELISNVIEPCSYIENNFQAGQLLPSSRHIAMHISSSANTTRLALEYLSTIGILEHKFKNSNENGWLVKSTDFTLDDTVEENVSLVKKVEKDLKDYITAKLKVGDRLPAHEALSKELSVSIKTIHDALKTLIDEGILLARRGRYGTTVVKMPDDKNIPIKKETSIFAPAVDTAFYYYEKTQNHIKKE